MRAPLRTRLLARVVWTEQECWEFRGANDQGYGVIGRGARGTGTVQTHRAAWEIFRGPIPAGLHIDHLCRNRMCCNPEHLEPVTQAENNRRSHAANVRTACRRGHPYVEGSYYQKLKQKECKECIRFRAEQKGQAA